MRHAIDAAECDNTGMAKDDVQTKVTADGLRYRSKASGSPFGTGGVFSAATMSCFKCGKHRPRAQLKTQRILGKSQVVCDPACGQTG